MGFVGAMAQTYGDLGYHPVGGTDGMAVGLAAMLQAIAGKSSPFVAIVVSEESADYRDELAWLAQRISTLGLADAHFCSLAPRGPGGCMRC